MDQLHIWRHVMDFQLNLKPILYFDRIILLHFGLNFNGNLCENHWINYNQLNINLFCQRTHNDVGLRPTAILVFDRRRQKEIPNQTKWCPATTNKLLLISINKLADILDKCEYNGKT